MAYTEIDNPTDFFNTVLYTGNAGTQAITGVGFAPNWVWGKARNATEGHSFHDTVRGTGKNMLANSDAAEEAIASVTAFGSDGFTLGSNAHMNNNNSPTVAWCWKAETAFSNDASSTSIGSIDSAGSVNNDAGFSIVSYTGTGSNGTIKHGLSSAPKMIIQKNRDESQPWWTYHDSIGAGGQLRLNENDAAGSDGGVLWNSTAPTSSVFSVGDNTGTNGSADKCIAYCFADVKGYSKFGSYTGNGNVDGTFIYTGFKPAFVMTKRTNGGGDWAIMDNKRNPFNVMNIYLKAQAADAEATGQSFDIDGFSNGFKLRYNNSNYNGNGGAYIYMAFAETPFVSSGNVPGTAR